MTGVFQGKIRSLCLEGQMMSNHVLSDRTNLTLCSPPIPQTKEFHNDRKSSRFLSVLHRTGN